MSQCDFKYMPLYISNFTHGLHSKIGNLYDKFWNPINYAIIGGIGVAINYAVWVALQNIFVWWMTNAFAIIVAWSWNWSMSVGPFGWLWGFKKKKEKQK